MKQKIFTNKIKLLLLMAFAMLVGQNAMGVTIVNFPMNATYTNTPSSYSAGNGGCRVTSTASGVVGYDNTTGATVSGWHTTLGKNWKTSVFNTTGYVSLSVTGQLKSSASGPRNFKIQYSLDGSNWVNVANLAPMTTELISMGTISLPAACANQAALYVRIATVDLQRQDGGTPIASGGTSSLLGFVISGETPSRPTTQASAITLIKMTTTSIKVGCTQGLGDHRIIVMNTTNNFSAPADNYNAGVANPVYGGSGEQVIYNGTGTTQTVTVTNSSNEYWFRVYDYNLNDGMTRYITTEESSNPKKCLLEICILPTHTNIGLITATLGGTVTDPPTGPTGSITSRGVYWSDTPDVTVNDNKVFEASNSTGIFTIDVLKTNSPQLPRGSRIYYKAFVENASGKSLSDESYFDNIPIFTGSGNWETPALWNVNEIPGSVTNKNGSVDDSPIIRGACTLTASNSVTDLTIDNGNSLAINTATTMNVTGTLTNDAGNSGILIKSADGVANGSLIWAAGTPSGTVQMYSKASKTGTKNRWQYFGIPVSSLLASTTFGGVGERVRKYDETNIATASWVRDGQVGVFNNPDYGLWFPGDANEASTGGTSTMVGSATPSLVPVDGYEVVQPNAKTYSFAGTLNHGDFSKDLAKTPGADWSGNHIIANPFTAAINISALDWTAGANLEQVVYLYNAGSRSDWENNISGRQDGVLAGQYTASTGAFAGQLGTPVQIPSMQGFLVYSNGNTNNTIGIPYSAVTSNNSAQRAKGVATEKIGTRIDVVGKQFADRMWIFSEESCTNKFDNGFDGFKFLGSALTPQLYAVGEDGIYQIDAVKDINNTVLGFKAGQERELKLTFTHQNTDSKYSSIFLVDLVANKTVDITASGTEYAFTTEATPTAVNRFKIITQTTAVKNPNASSLLKLVSSQSNIVVSNPTNEAGSLVIYNLSGSAIQTVRFDANGLVTIPINLGKGIYVAKATTSTEEVTEKLIIR